LEVRNEPGRILRATGRSMGRQAVRSQYGSNDSVRYGHTSNYGKVALGD
jgi:hypothetical protein